MNAALKTDQDIIDGINAGGLDREKALYHVFYQLDWKGLVIRYVLDNRGNQQDGEDLAQDVLVILDRNIRADRFKGKSALKTYFFSIARLQWLKKLRDRKPMDELKTEHYEQEEEAIFDSSISDKKKKLLDKVFEQIGDRCKKVLLMQQLGHNLEEIAKTVGLSSDKMAKKQAYRCRNRFKKFFENLPNWKNLIS